MPATIFSMTHRMAAILSAADRWRPVSEIARELGEHPERVRPYVRRMESVGWMEARIEQTPGGPSYRRLLAKTTAAGQKAIDLYHVACP